MNKAKILQDIQQDLNELYAEVAELNRIVEDIKSTLGGCEKGSLAS